jgi:hypothetical protein
MLVDIAGDGSSNKQAFYFVAPSGSYQGIDDLCGVTEITDKTNIEYRFPACSIEEMVRSTVCSRRRLRLNDATAGRERYKDVIVAEDLVGAFDAAVAGKTTNGKTVRYAYEPSKNKYRA